MKKFFYGLVIFVAVVFVALFIFAKLPSSTPSISASSDQLNDPALIKKGEYLAILGDCAACHTKKDGLAFTGGAPLQSPIGLIYAPNITPDNQNGIGHYTLNDFSRALRNGIRKDGVTLYPAMPYPAFSKLNDEDVIALYAYFKNNVKAENVARTPNEIHWPLSIRWPVAIWRKLYAPDAVPFDPNRYPDEITARGAYITQGLGHCGTCHTPRAITLQEKGLDETSPDYLAGNTMIDGWVTLNLRNNDDGLKNWSKDDIVQSLSTGVNSKGAVIGTPMNDFVHQSGRFFHQDDLNAVATYLKTLTSKRNDGIKYQSQESTVAPKDSNAAFIYQINCSSCHGTNGQGTEGLFPSLVANPTVLSDNPQSIIRIVLTGFTNEPLKPNTLPMTMPALGNKLSDEDIAKVVSFIRTNWGNHAATVNKKEVSHIRKEFAPSQK